MSEPRGFHPGPAARTLPVWPLTAMFGLVPLWWLLGAFNLIWPLFGLLLLALLVLRGRVRLPLGTGLWLVFLALAVLSTTQLLQLSQLQTWALRAGFYATALVVCVYAYNLLRDRVPWHRVLLPLCLFWLGLVGLGWLGVLAPRLQFTTPVELLLPGGLAKNPFVHDLVHIRTCEYSARSLHPTYRPSAPFPYTNNWGSTFALLVPCVVAYIMSVRRGALRMVLLVSLPLGLPPAFLTLNRGMFVSLGAGLLVLAVRALLRGNLRVIASLLSVVVLGWLATLFIPVGELIAQRTSSSDTNEDRFGLYTAVLQMIARSPVLGFGAPRTVDTTSAAAPVGTQGQLWLVMFSHGIPALLCFASWILLVGLRCIQAKSPAGQWLGIIPFTALVQLPFYGLGMQNLTVLFFAAGVALAALDGPVNRVPYLRRPARRRGPTRPRSRPVDVGRSRPPRGRAAVPVPAGAVPAGSP